MSRLSKLINSTDHLKKYDIRTSYCYKTKMHSYTNIKSLRDYYCKHPCRTCVLHKDNSLTDFTDLLEHPTDASIDE